MDHGREAEALLEELTDKQKEVLDLLVLHKTSKQIARDLGISPHTVDQRIAAARKKFGVDTRNELAAAYMAAKTESGSDPIYEKPVYQSSQVETPAHHGDQDLGTHMVTGSDEVQSQPEFSGNSTKSPVYYRVVPESFEGRYGLFWRLIAIVGITLGLLIATLVGLAVYGELSELMRQAALGLQSN